MANIDITKTYQDGDILVEADLDNIINDVETFLNTTKVNDDNIQDAGITASSKLIDDSISTAKLADDCVTSAKIAATAVVSSSEHNGFVGEVRLFHTFNGAVSIPRGWMPLDGDVVNQTNYDAQHGSGAYTADGVASSALLNKNLPDMSGNYAVGATSTTQSGSSAITTVGNASHQVNLQHNHTVDSHTHAGATHNHQWYNYNGTGSTDHSFTSAGAINTLTPATTTSGEHILLGTGNSIGENLHTNNATGTTGAATPDTDNSLSTTQSIQPESVEFIYIMKVV